MDQTRVVGGMCYRDDDGGVEKDDDDEETTCGTNKGGGWCVCCHDSEGGVDDKDDNDDDDDDEGTQIKQLILVVSSITPSLKQIGSQVAQHGTMSIIYFIKSDQQDSLH